MKYLKIIGRIGLFSLIFAVILYYLSWVFIPKNNLDQAGMRDVSANGILSEKKETIDVLILGDSEAYSSIIPMEMYEKYGFTSYVLATPGQPLYYTKTLLDRTLQTQKPQLVVLETNAIYRSFQPFSPLAEKARKVFPIFEYHDRWKSLRVEDFSLDIHYTYNNVMKGYRFNNNVQAVTSLDSYMKETDQVQTIPKINLLFLNMIIDTCEKAEIPVLLLSTPSPVNWNMGKHLAVADYARDKGLTYVDLNLQDLETPIDWKMDTRDAGDHLNDAGALKVTHFLGNYLYDHFSLPDHRQDKDYLSWKESLSLYHQMVDENRKKMKQ